MYENIDCFHISPELQGQFPLYVYTQNARATIASSRSVTYGTNKQSGGFRIRASVKVCICSVEHVCRRCTHGLNVPHPTFNHVGICRIAFMVDDIEKTYEKLKAMQAEFVGEGGRSYLPNVATVKILMFKDPDGTVIEAAAKIPGI